MSALVNLDLVLHPREYQPPLFVNRDDELRIIEKKVRQAQAGGIITEPVVNFWGTGRVGKTWILRHLRHLYEYRAEPTTAPPPLERPTFALLYTFPDEPTTASLPDVAKALAAEALLQIAPALTTVDQRLLVQARDTGSIRDLVRALVELSHDFVPLMLLDSAEKVPSAVWQELELRLIEPLVTTGRVLIVVVGRRQVPRWRRFEVRRRVMEPDKTQVRAFDRSAVIKQINQRDYRIPVDLLFPYTAGNPHLVDAIAQNVLAWTKGVEPDRASLDHHRDGLLQILRVYEEQLLENVSPDLQRVLCVVSPLRFYRLEALRFMLTKQNTVTEIQPDGYYLQLLYALDQQTEVVWWSRERRAYTTDEMVRRVVNRRQLLEDSADYATRHRQALEMYWHWAQEHPEASEDFIVEIWFHLASLYLADSDLPRLRSETERALDFAREKLTAERLLILQKQLQGDKELLDLLPDDLPNELVQRLEQSLNRKAQSLPSRQPSE